MRWTFANILLVDSTTNEPLSHGRTSFRIHLLEPVAPGVEVANAADIFFDFNLPIRTPDAVVFIETSRPLHRLPTSALVVGVQPGPDRFTVGGSAQLVCSLHPGHRLAVVLERALSVGNPTVSTGGLGARRYLVEMREADGTRVAGLVKQKAPSL
ncbi:MAG: hypothetical protein IPN85_18990 [Flavobacteriales bacterium]|nr:hypothetical protein [Flavobacteriales bacterium]